MQSNYINSNKGLLRLKDLSDTLHKYEENARRFRKAAHHVIFAAKSYKDDKIDMVWLYNPPLVVDEKEFDRIAGLKDYLIYAYHN